MPKTRMRVRTLIGTALVLAMAAFAPAADASFPGRNGKIAVWEVPDPDYDGPGFINVVSPRTGKVGTLLTDSEILPPASSLPEVLFPSYSADGKRIAFTGGWSPDIFPPPFQEHIFVMTAAGKGVTQLTNEPDLQDSDPAFSPSGELIAFERSTAGNPHGSHIYVIKDDGTGAKQLTFGADPTAAHPSFSPNGHSIVFDSKRGLVVMRPNGSQKRVIVPNGKRFRALEPEFSPDGHRITFESNRHRRCLEDIYVARADGSRIRRITHLHTPASRSCRRLRSAYSPTFSPDGLRIAFIDGETLATIRPNGKGTPKRFEDASDSRDPSWQPLPPG